MATARHARTTWANGKGAPQAEAKDSLGEDCGSGGRGAERGISLCVLYIFAFNIHARIWVIVIRTHLDILHLEKELKGGRRHEGGEGGKEGGTREDRRVRSEGTCMAVTQF